MTAKTCIEYKLIGPSFSDYELYDFTKPCLEDEILSAINLKKMGKNILAAMCFDSALQRLKQISPREYGNEVHYHKLRTFCYDNLIIISDEINPEISAQFGDEKTVYLQKRYASRVYQNMFLE